jgi:hypothetical protein
MPSTRAPRPEPITHLSCQLYSAACVMWQPTLHTTHNSIVIMSYRRTRTSPGVLLARFSFFSAGLRESAAHAPGRPNTRKWTSWTAGVPARVARSELGPLFPSVLVREHRSLLRTLRRGHRSSDTCSAHPWGLHHLYRGPKSRGPKPTLFESSRRTKATEPAEPDL